MIIGLESTLAWVSILTVAQELHQRYYEPLARIAGSLDEIVQGPPMKKLLFMTDPAVIDTQLKPLWQARLTPPSLTVETGWDLCLLLGLSAMIGRGVLMLSCVLKVEHALSLIGMRIFTKICLQLHYHQ